MKKKQEDGSKSYYCLNFSYTFKYDKDLVYFAYAEPYTYTELQDFLQEIQQNAKFNKIYQRETLCESIGSLKCDLLTITSPKVSNQQKKCVFITSRVHPGETVGSHMCKGLIEFLLSESVEAVELREKCIFKIVPMLNPDGVVQGNYRTSLSGNDLNRRYNNPDKLLHPTIFAIKNYIKKFTKKNNLLFYCDLHGHSKSKDVFMYGNTSEANPNEYRVFPYLMGKICDYFSYKSSKFAVQKSKASTARITMWKELDVPYIYTLESSFLGPSNANIEGSHFKKEHLEQIGKNLCQTIRLFGKLRQPLCEAFSLEMPEFEAEIRSKLDSLNEKDKQILEELFKKGNSILGIFHCIVKKNRTKRK